MITSFTCIHCNKEISLTAPGTKNRNHCPYCLFSLHLDQIPGDRASMCHGKMSPIGKVYKQNGEEMLVHKCVKCGVEIKNRVAGDDSIEVIASLPELDSSLYR